MVVISGPAIMAGSRPIFFAKIGNDPPITLAKITVMIILKDTVAATQTDACCIMRILAKFITANTIPTKKILILNSFHMTLNISLRLISSRAKPRIIRVADWEPAFPAVSISMGINEVKYGHRIQDILILLNDTPGQGSR